jgi:hypothetical protein
MSETKHTREPWYLGETPWLEFPSIIIKCKDWFIARTLGGNDEANARLIVAACNSYNKHYGPRAVECAEDDLLGELLKACKLCVRAMDNVLEPPDVVTTGDWSNLEAIRRQTEAAIAKARRRWPMSETKHISEAEIWDLLSNMMDDGYAYTVRALYKLCRHPEYRLFDSVAMLLEKRGLIQIEDAPDVSYGVRCFVDDYIRQVALTCITIRPDTPRYGVVLSDRPAKSRTKSGPVGSKESYHALRQSLPDRRRGRHALRRRAHSATRPEVRLQASQVYS